MIILKSLQEIETIRKACLIVADVLDHIREQVRPGMSTEALDEIAERRILDAGAKPAFKGYRGYPKTLCTSVNNEVIHGIPSKEVVLSQGDIVSIDVGAIVDGFYGDAAITIPVGTVTKEAERRSKSCGSSRLFDSKGLRGSRNWTKSPRGSPDSELRVGRAGAKA
jgi:methionyl aminopeptidase